jgi:hypothetical protein
MSFATIICRKKPLIIVKEFGFINSTKQGFLKVKLKGKKVYEESSEKIQIPIAFHLYFTD